MLSGSAQAQWARTNSLEFANGYERNIFRNPESLITQGDTLGRAEMWQNGMYQTIQSRNSIRRELKKGMLELTANGGVGIFHTEVPANEYNYKLAASYRVRYADGRFAEFAPAFDRVKRQGIDITEIELRAPFSYHKAVLPIHMDFYKGKRIWIRTEGGVVGKLYDRELNERLRYIAPYLSGEVSKKWISEGGTIKVLAHSRAEWRRIYDRMASTSSATGEITYTDRFRHWHFYTLGAGVKYKSSDDKWQLAADFHHIARIDRDAEFTFHHTGISADVEYHLKKFKMGLVAAYGLRNYPNLVPGRNNNSALRYVYRRAAVNASYQMNKLLTVQAAYLINNRDSNNPSETMIGFRGYENMLVEAGLKMNF
jgi:hypothetical protein